MATTNRLNSTTLSKLPDGWHSDGNGLYLRVLNNERYWVFRKMIKGRRVTESLGKLSLISLKDARKEALKKQYHCLMNGLKPRVKFNDFYEEGIHTLQEVRQWKSARRTQIAVNQIKKYAAPVIGHKMLDDITVDDVYSVLKPIWADKHETAKAILQTLKLLFDYAKQKGFKESADNPAVWNGQLSVLLPPTNKIHTKQHRAAPKINEVPGMVATWYELADTHLKCAIFGMLTACRAQEFVLAKWSEIDFENAVFSVPPERRKDGKSIPFCVPLSTQAIDLLKSIPKVSDLIFKADAEVMRSSWLLNYLKKTGYQYTLHGMRSTFSDWCAENGKDPILREKSLCHTTDNAVGQAYQRSDLLEQRRPLMQEWSDYCFSGVQLGQ